MIHATAPPHLSGVRGGTAIARCAGGSAVRVLPSFLVVVVVVVVCVHHNVGKSEHQHTTAVA